MKIKLKKITVRELAEEYKDDAEGGVIGYGGKLDIRPPYQREFVYKDKQRDAVIDTITKDFPLNVMYWAVREDDNYEIIDGQQRTISICQFVKGKFSFGKRYFHNLKEDEKNKILNYKLMIYLCSGDESEKLEWFKIINIAGLKLKNQELRNAVYSGTWVTDAKRYFSKPLGPAHAIGSNYLSGSANRQAYLEAAIKWISDDNVEIYMAQHQHDQDAEALWEYFKDVIAWVETVFSNYRKEMEGVPFGALYNEFKDTEYDSKEIEEEIKKLMEDEDVTNKKGIYEYVLTRDEKHLNIRVFNSKQKREAYERQEGICVVCEKHFKLDEMQGDHITPWSKGGKTIPENCQMLCAKDNRKKSGK